MLSARLAAWLEAGEAAAIVSVTGVQGSAPRDVGATMAVTLRSFSGTIGGGALEAQAIEVARNLLLSEDLEITLDQPLGPEIGQCCGGRVQLSITVATPGLVNDIKRTEAIDGAEQPAVLIFGAGHTGGALARALAPLPLNVSVIDERSDWLASLSNAANCVQSALPEAEIAAAPSGAGFVIMTHDHALDFLIAEAALARGDAGYVGMIGSASKRAKLTADLARKDVASDTLVCPIGAGGSDDKRPEVIAAATAAEITAALL